MTKTIIIIAVLILGVVGGRAEAGPRCISIAPICPPGQHPICLCESDYSYNCAWVCAGR